MKKVILAILVLAFALFLALPNLSWAQEDVYKAKCAACHGADGKGSELPSSLRQRFRALLTLSYQTSSRTAARRRRPRMPSQAKASARLKRANSQPT
jgi:mono/diheme cytochrome c family protein